MGPSPSLTPGRAVRRCPAAAPARRDPRERMSPGRGPRANGLPARRFWGLLPMAATPAGDHTRLMRARDTSSPGAWQGWTGWLRRREDGGGPALLYVTCAVTTAVVLAITLLAVSAWTWMVGVAFMVLVLA